MDDVKELIARAKDHATDWNGEQMPDAEPAKGDPTAGFMRALAAALSRLADAEERAWNEAIEAAAKCGHPRSDHPYRHPFVASAFTDPAKAIRALKRP